MVAISYIGVIDSERVNILTNTLKTSNASWYPINQVPKLAYDHNEILNEAVECLKKKIIETNIFKKHTNLF